MKYIGYWEFNPEDIDMVLEKLKQVMAEIEKGSEKFPKIIFPAHVMGGELWKGFWVCDATPEQLTNMVFHYMGVARNRFVPITEASKFMELYEKIKK